MSRPVADPDRVVTPATQDPDHQKAECHERRAARFRDAERFDRLAGIARSDIVQVGVSYVEDALAIIRYTRAFSIETSSAYHPVDDRDLLALTLRIKIRPPRMRVTQPARPATVLPKPPNCGTAAVLASRQRAAAGRLQLGPGGRHFSLELGVFAHDGVHRVSQ